MNNESDWKNFIDLTAIIQNNLIQFITNVLWEIEWPEPNVQAASLYNLWSQYKTDIREILQQFINVDDKYECKWCEKATKQLIFTLNQSTSMYFEIIFYHNSYTGDWTVYTQHLKPSTQHLVHILSNDVRSSMSGDYPLHANTPPHILIYKLVQRRFVCWLQPCKTIISCLSIRELQHMQLAFAMITNKKLTESMHTPSFDPDLVSFIFSLVFNQSCRRDLTADELL